MKKSVIFYGAGQNAHDKFSIWTKRGLFPVCFADRAVEKWHTLFDIGCSKETEAGKRIWILPLPEAIAKYPDYEIYLTHAPQNLSTVVDYLLERGIPPERIRSCESVEAADIVPEHFLRKEREQCWEGKVCPLPFYHPHIVMNNRGGVSVYPCCPGDNPNEIEFLYPGQDFDEAWNGGYGKVIKNKVRDRDFSDCALGTCASRGRYLEAFDFMDRFRASYGRFPMVIKFMHDYECNLHCTMCRDTIRTHTRDELETLDGMIDSVFLPMCQNADAVYFAGDGDPFASRHYKKLIKKIADRYPRMKFLLHTNGLLCDAGNCEKLGITDRVDSILISVNAASEETYERVMADARWDQLMENIRWIRSRMAEGKIAALYFSFVVQKANYSEMADFVRFAQEHQAHCRFTLCHHEPHSTISRCDENDIFHLNHPKFSEYCKILTDSVFDWEGCYLDPYSKYIRQYCTGKAKWEIERQI